ncbi:hypothetical protein TcasGA2_TC034345 [Tribolium castaneum]|uniref:Uncharacterized protein n=1 Tax=Tribolium castaneum TaxID=7070 RepID=A0A139WB55_TRICA|nr:hypothetical protein TcasGA2_TC034345 [Tribolium castaneum]
MILLVKVYSLDRRAVSRSITPRILPENTLGAPTSVHNYKQQLFFKHTKSGRKAIERPIEYKKKTVCFVDAHGAE